MKINNCACAVTKSFDLFHWELDLFPIFRLLIESFQFRNVTKTNSYPNLPQFLQKDSTPLPHRLLSQLKKIILPVDFLRFRQPALFFGIGEHEATIPTAAESASFFPDQGSHLAAAEQNLVVKHSQST